MKLTKVTMSALIVFVLTAIICVVATIFDIRTTRTTIIILAPIAVIFLYQGLDYSKSPFKLKNFTIKKDSLKLCSMALAIGIGCFIIANVFMDIFDEKMQFIVSVFLVGSAGCFIVTCISYLQISLSIDEIMSVKSDIITFYIFIAIALLNFPLHYYLPKQIEFIGLASLFILLPSILLFLRSLRNRRSFLPNFLMSMSFLTIFISNYVMDYLKKPRYLEILIIDLSISLTIIAIDQAREIAKAQPITDNLNQQQ